MSIKRPIKNIGYGFGTVIFLVIALSCLAVFAFLNQRDSDKLTQTVNDLSTTRSSIDNVDKAIQLLYAAENNSRMYILYRDANFANLYKSQLEEVSNVLKQVATETQSKDDNQNFKSLMEDKSKRTALYIQARVLMDSLLLQKDLPLAVPKGKAFVTHFKLPIQHQAKVDTQHHSNVVEVKSKKKLFKRLKDAFVNKSDRTVNDSVIINDAARDSIYIIRERELVRNANIVNDQAKYFQLLREREKSLLSANHMLLTGLQSVLIDLKGNIAKNREERKTILSTNAFNLTHSLKISNTLLIGFGLLLTLIILVILQRLFRYSKTLKLQKEEAEEHARLKSEFAETMSHEIRTPLHSIATFADELSANVKEGGQSEVVDAIKLSSRMLLSVVNNILDYTKMEKGKFKLAAIPFNPKGVIQEIVMGLMLQAKRKDIDLVENMDVSVDTVLIGDSFQLRQLLINILSNAIKYTDKGSISVDATLQKKSKEQVVLKLAVKDTGIGIELKDSDVFEAYATAVHRNEIQEGSTGLGLSIVKKVVDLHKGSIQVRSIVGRGTTFFITLPYKLGTSIMLDDHQRRNIQMEAMGLQVSGTKDKSMIHRIEADNKTPIKILIVDNDPLNLKYLVMLLQRENHKVTEAKNGKTALELFQQHRYDLIITDISMPEISGYDLAKEVRSDNDIARRDTPIIAVSGYDSEQEVKSGKAEKNLFDGWLQKPFLPKALHEMIKNVTIALKK